MFRRVGGLTLQNLTLQTIDQNFTRILGIFIAAIAFVMSRSAIWTNCRLRTSIQGRNACISSQCLVNVLPRQVFATSVPPPYELCDVMLYCIRLYYIIVPYVMFMLYIISYRIKSQHGIVQYIILYYIISYHIIVQSVNNRQHVRGLRIDVRSRESVQTLLRDVTHAMATTRALERTRQHVPSEKGHPEQAIYFLLTIHIFKIWLANARKTSPSMYPGGA